MNRHPSIQHVIILLSLLTTLALEPEAHAGERRFEPSPQSKNQLVQVLKEATIISAAGKQISAGASMTPASARRVWLSVSVKNTSAAPLDFNEGAVQVMSAGEPLQLHRIHNPATHAEDDGYMRDPCANATSSSQINCNIDSFNRRQHQRLEATRPAPETVKAERQLAPGELAVQQFQLDLPKKNQASPTTLTVSVTAGGEQLSFDFSEVD